MKTRPPISTAAFIAAHLPLVPAPSRPDILLHMANPGSRLGALAGGSPEAASRQPYWAFHWAGGVALARYLEDHPECVAGKRVLDFGAGSGIVAIAAAKAGACLVTAAEIDPNGRAAIALNAAANHVSIVVLPDDIGLEPLPDVDVVLAGDVFYDPEPARISETFLNRCAASGQNVLVGDPGRRYLPRRGLRHIADYAVADFGISRSGASVIGAIYAVERLEADRNIHHLHVDMAHSTGFEPAKNGE